MRSIRPDSRKGIATVEGRRLFESIRLQNFLSFGPESEAIELQPLNVLIGPNGSGKSNLIEAFSVLQAAPTDLTVPFRQGGGATEWMWKGEGDDREAQIAVTTAPRLRWCVREMYELRLQTSGGGLLVGSELASQFQDGPREHTRDLVGRLRFPGGVRRSRSLDLPEAETPDAVKGAWRGMEKTDIEVPDDQSLLAQRWSPSDFRQLSALANSYRRVAIYRDWTFGPTSAVRGAKSAELPGGSLLPDGSNLPQVLSGLMVGGLRAELVEKTQKLLPTIKEINVEAHSGIVQLFMLEEDRSRPIPATRLSDGTLRYLCLLAILLNPKPPGLVCIEEPELGFHPDIIPTVADLLKDASQRMQLIVTTHSDILVSALSDVPEAIVVCERFPTGTQMRRLDPEPLKEWLEKYRLGEIWRMGEIGGNRWG